MQEIQEIIETKKSDRHIVRIYFEHENQELTLEKSSVNEKYKINPDKISLLENHEQYLEKQKIEIIKYEKRLYGSVEGLNKAMAFEAAGALHLKPDSSLENSPILSDHLKDIENSVNNDAINLSPKL